MRMSPLKVMAHVLLLVGSSASAIEQTSHTTLAVLDCRLHETHLVVLEVQPEKAEAKARTCISKFTTTREKFRLPL